MNSRGILDPENKVAGEMVEESPVRRWFRLSQRARHRIDLGGRTVATMTPAFRPFTPVSHLQLLPVEDPIEPRFAIACAVVAQLAGLERAFHGA